MRETEGIIERVRRLSPQLQRLEVSVAPALQKMQAGQWLMAQVERHHYDPYLREMWIPAAIEQGQIVVDRPASYDYRPGEVVSLIGPVGTPIPLIGGGGKHLLLIAQDTDPTPLLLLAQQAVAQMSEVALVLLGAAANYPFTGIPPAVEVITGKEASSWNDQEKIIQWADQVFAVVHEGFWMDNFSGLYATVRQHRLKVPLNFMYGIFTLPMPCGTGACTACMVRCKTANKLACVEGPAIDLAEVLLA